MDPAQNPDQTSWQECPSETISGLVRHQRRLSRRDVLATFASGGITIAATVVCGVAVWRSTRPRWTNPPLGAITPVRFDCDVVYANIDGYLADKVSCCVRQEIDQHLAMCEPCRDFLETYQQQSAGDQQDA